MQLQRIGRTGRARQGRIVVLMSEGREERNVRSHSCPVETSKLNFIIQWDKAKDKHEDVLQAIIGGKRFECYSDCERLVPAGIQPTPDERVIEIPEQLPTDVKKRGRMTKRTTEGEGETKKRKKEKVMQLPDDVETGFKKASALSPPKTKEQKLEDRCTAALLSVEQSEELRERWRKPELRVGDFPSFSGSITKAPGLLVKASSYRLKICNILDLGEEFFTNVSTLGDWKKTAHNAFDPERVHWWASASLGTGSRPYRPCRKPTRTTRLESSRQVVDLSEDDASSQKDVDLSPLPSPTAKVLSIPSPGGSPIEPKKGNLSSPSGSTELVFAIPQPTSSLDSARSESVHAVDFSVAEPTAASPPRNNSRSSSLVIDLDSDEDSREVIIRPKVLTAPKLVDSKDEDIEYLGRLSEVKARSSPSFRNPSGNIPFVAKGSSNISSEGTRPIDNDQLIVEPGISGRALSRGTSGITDFEINESDWQAIDKVVEQRLNKPQPNDAELMPPPKLPLKHPAHSNQTSQASFDESQESSLPLAAHRGRRAPAIIHSSSSQDVPIVGKGKRKAQIPIHESPATDEPKEGAIPVPKKKLKKGNLPMTKNKNGIFDIEAVNSDESKEASSESYATEDSSDRAFVANETSEDANEGVSMMNFYRDSLMSQVSCLVKAFPMEI